ncbi:MAG: hypothetical protein OXC98_10435 [bacterium]|nr:hypothetical protein [Acidimicrobiia bacterium]MCY4650766.1 hypothetical protein [bacterium]
MNLRRARSPEGRPSTNNSIGLVTVDDPGEMLIAKTDRSGFIENDAFSELREFCGDALDWMAKRRVAERDRKRKKQRKSGKGRRQGAVKDVEKAVAGIPENQRKGVTEAVERLNRESDSEREAILSDLQLYRTLSTVGTTASVFALEADGPLTRIGRLARAIERRAQKCLVTPTPTTWKNRSVCSNEPPKGYEASSGSRSLFCSVKNAGSASSKYTRLSPASSNSSIRSWTISR